MLAVAYLLTVVTAPVVLAYGVFMITQAHRHIGCATFTKGTHNASTRF